MAKLVDKQVQETIYNIELSESEMITIYLALGMCDETSVEKWAEQKGLKGKHADSYCVFRFFALEMEV